MLKSIEKDRIVCVTQPEHGDVSGYMAAHWGNDQFARPGHFASSPNAQQLHAEVVFAISQHDNGWWEWEASPTVDSQDGLPIGLLDVLQNQQQAMERWTIGVARFSDAHPYASLLIAEHAKWLYIPQCRRLTDSEVSFRHPLFWNREPSLYTGEEFRLAAEFVRQIERSEAQLVSALRHDHETRSWPDPWNLHPHVRLLQTLDALSLALCSDVIPDESGEKTSIGHSHFKLHDVPRHSDSDRVTIDVKPCGVRQICIDPFPFDTDPLPVQVPARIFIRPSETTMPGSFHWHSGRRELLCYTLVSSQNSG